MHINSQNLDDMNMWEKWFRYQNTCVWCVYAGAFKRNFLLISRLVHEIIHMDLFNFIFLFFALLVRRWWRIMVDWGLEDNNNIVLITRSTGIDEHWRWNKKQHSKSSKMYLFNSIFPNPHQMAGFFFPSPPT